MTEIITSQVLAEMHADELRTYVGDRIFLRQLNPPLDIRRDESPWSFLADTYRYIKDEDFRRNVRIILSLQI